MLTGVECRSSLLSSINSYTAFLCKEMTTFSSVFITFVQKKLHKDISQTQWWDHDAHRGKEGWKNWLWFSRFLHLFSLLFLSLSLCSPCGLSKSGISVPTQWAFRLWDLRVKDRWEDKSMWNHANHTTSKRFICGTNPGRSCRGVVSSAQWVNDWLQIAKHSNSDIWVLAASANHDLSCSPKPPACLRLLWRHSMLSHFPCKLSSLVWLPPVFPLNWLNRFSFFSLENSLFPLKTSNEMMCIGF